MIYDHLSVDRLLGCLVKDTSLANSERFPLDKDDFQTQFHKIIYSTLHNLSKRGVKTASFIDIDLFIQPYTAQYNVFLDNDGEKYIDTIQRLVDVDNFECYYNTVRKLSLIKEAKDDGDCVDKFWDESKDDKDNISNVEQYTIDEILDYFSAKEIKRRRKYSQKKVKEEYVAGTDFLEYKEKFKEEPLIGNSFQSSSLNGIFRGMFGFIIRIAKSGGGKSILSIGDLCKCTMTEYWDYETQSFVENKSREGSSLFINTELEIREELDPIIIAWISGVERSHIIDGKYDDGEEERVEYANQILLESGLYIVDDPEFTTKSLIETIRDYSLNKGIKTVCFDYIQSNGFVGKELSSETSVPQREDMILLALTDKLKQVQRECGISLISSCQSNGTEDNMEYPTEACMAGGKSQVRKTNGTMAMFPPTKKELELTSMMIAKFNKGTIGQGIVPNNVVHIIKGRGSKYPKNTKLFQYIDLGTGRSIDMFCTDKYNNPISVEKMIIERE